MMTSIITDNDHQWSGVVYSMESWSVSLSVCQPWRKFIFTHPVHLWWIWVKSVYEGHQVKVKDNRSENGWKSLFQRCTTSVGNNSVSIAHRVANFVCSIGFWADWVVWPPSLSRDQKWPQLTKCTHSRVVGLR